jgi:predicted small metal-binding protein
MHEYEQYQCEECGFRTRSPHEQEVIEIVQRHAEEWHDRTLDADAVRGDLQTLQFEE